MKIKQQLIIRDQLAFAKGNYNQCFTLIAPDYIDVSDIPEWTYVGEIEIDVDVSIDKVKQDAVAEIEKRQQEAKANFSVLMQTLENEKQSLLALDHIEG